MWQDWGLQLGSHGWPYFCLWICLLIGTGILIQKLAYFHIVKWIIAIPFILWIILTFSGEIYWMRRDPNWSPPVHRHNHRRNHM